jgi:hypothetical protein
MASDRIVSPKVILQAQLELQRLGTHKAMVLLESTEPDLAEVVIEATTAQYHQILHTGASSKAARRIHEMTLALVLTCVGSLRHAHAALWQFDDGAAPVDPTPPPPRPQ